MSRESALVNTFVDLADTLVADFDVIELLSKVTDGCVEVLNVDAAGLMLISPDGDLRVMASSSDVMRILELFEIQANEGPCLDCYRTGEPVINQDLSASEQRWPKFTVEALKAGFHSVDALPMRLRGTIIGALNLFHMSPGKMADADVAAAQAFADVATIGVLGHRAAIEGRMIKDQLNVALNSRIILEQAKGVLAERENLDMDASFSRLRTYARENNLRLIDVAQDIIGGAPLGRKVAGA